MKTLKITLLIMVLGLTNLFSQQLKSKVELSKPYPVIDAKSKIYFKIGNSIMTMKDNTLQMFNIDKMNLANIGEYELPKKAVFDYVDEINDKIYMFYDLYDKENETEQLFYKAFNSDLGKFEPDGHLLFKVKGKVSGTLVSSGFYSYETINKFDFEVANDESKLLIKYRVKPEIKDDSKNNDVIGVYVYNSDMTKIFGKEVAMPYTEKKMDNLDYSIDVDGNVYILTRIYNDETTKLEKDDKPNFHLEILKIDGTSGTVTKTPINLGDKYVKQLSVFECTAEYMICLGLSSKDIKSDPDGIVVFKILKGGALSDITYYKIPLEVINMYETDKSQEKNEKKEDEAEFSNLYLDHLIIQDDGSIVVVGEKYYSVCHTTYSNGRSYTTCTYHYDDILITKIDKSGQLAWMKKLPKRQTSGKGQGGLSYKYMEGEGCHYLLYLDNVKNMNLPLNKRPAQHVDGKGGYLTAYKVQDSDGKTEKISILNMDNVKGIELFQFAVNRIIPVTLNSFIFEAYKKQKEDVLVKVTF